MRQQLLDLFNNVNTFDNYIKFNSNVEKVCSALNTNQYRFMNIVGMQSSGKTHLLQSWVNQLSQNNKAYYYNNITFHSITASRILQSYDFIAVDNIELLPYQEQVILFDLFNLIKSDDNKRLLTSATAMTNIFKDLSTRIESGLNLTIYLPNDDELLYLLSQYTAIHKLNINNNILKYLLNHASRNVGYLIKIISMADMTAVEKKVSINNYNLINEILEKHPL